MDNFEAMQDRADRIDTIIAMVILAAFVAAPIVMGMINR